MTMSEEITVFEKQRMLRQRRSLAEKTWRAFTDNGKNLKGLKEGAGKGLEPKPWCECHNRNPCPIDKELGI